MGLKQLKITMTYVCELGSGHFVYLDNRENQTIITATVGQPGQQQQASNSLTTGPWTAPPEAYRYHGGAVFKVFGAQGDVCIYVQGSSISMTGDVPADPGSQQISMQQTLAAPSMPSMPPLGTMQMTMNPMNMRMGNMELSMDVMPKQQPSTTRKFCSQCGASVAPTDRFCSHCGHALS